MREQDLVNIIRSYRRDSIGANDGALSNERAKAMDRYHGRPMGNEVEGRSAVVSKDLAETVGWALPGILRVFVQSGNIAEFDPVGPEDEELAKQETDTVNWVVMKQNDGFLVLHDAIKDALLLKNCYVKHYWDETEKVETEQYSGLTLDELTQLITSLESEGATVEIAGQESKTEIIETPQGPMPLEVFDVSLRITRKEGKVTLEAVPPEEIRVSKDCRNDLQKAAFVEHVTTKTRTDLIQMGMDRAFVDSLPSYNEEDNDNEIRARDSVSDESDSFGSSVIDRSMDEIEFCEAYILVDFDGDGVAERRKVVTCADRIPPGDEWNEAIDCVPITGGVPQRIPHRHVGESLDDDIADLQEIKTTLVRQMLDNIYMSNNQQWLVNERVNLSDFMQSLPGGIKRIRGLEPVSGAVEQVMATPIMQQIMPAIDYIDGTKEARTGINRATTGLDPDILKQSTKGAFMENLNRASQKIEMITRMLAETLVKPMLLQVHALLIKHQDKPLTIKLRGKYVPVNPQEWRERTNMTLRVGLGTGSEEEKREKLALLTQLQDRLLPMGIAGPMQAYNLFADMAQAMGFDMPEKYAMNPQSPEYQQMMAQQQQQQQPVNPLAEVEHIKQQGLMQKYQMDMAFKQWQEEFRAQQEQQASMLEMRMQMMNDAAERRSRELIEAAKLEFSMLLKQMQPPDIGPVGMGAGLGGA